MKLNIVVMDQNLDSKQDAFAKAADVLLEQGYIEDKELYIASLKEREVQGTTGLIDGFAIPHGKSETVKEAAVVYIRNNHGIAWESLDDSLVTDIFALAIPANGEAHLDALIAISSNLMDDEQRQKLRMLNDADAIKNIFE